MGYFKQNIAIDLGTATVLVCVDGKGVVIKAPSIVAVKEGTNEVLAIGDEARLMMGRTPFDITTVRPVQNGVISSYTVTKAMIAFLFSRRYCVSSIPASISSFLKRLTSMTS